MRKTLVILTCNEIEGVRALFDKIPFSQFDESFVIDWNSRDGTVEFFKEKGIKVISQQKKGRGAAFKIAAREAKGDILVFFSPDGQEDYSDIMKIVQAVEQQGYDMAIASRFAPGSSNDQTGHFFPYRAWGNRFFTFLANLFFGGKLSDALTGFRAIRKDRFEELRISVDNFAIEYQISIRAMKRKFKIKEIPTQERDRIGGKSKVGTIPVGLEFIKLLFRELWSN